MTAGAVEDAEVELKLELTPEGADALEAAGVFSGDATVILQHAVYFDTPDQALSAAGLSLRIRRNGDRRVQTVKADGAAAGMFIRPEWERDVDGDQPVIDHATPIPALLGDKVSAIAPLFDVENERRLWNVGGVEVALDRGRVLAGDRETPLCEVELEHKSGDPLALFALARRIDGIASVHLGVLSKAERGYRLLGPISSPSKASAIALKPDMTAAAAFQAIAFACLRHFRLNVPFVTEHRDAAALHQARVAIRRLRSALTIHKRLFTDDSAKALNAQLRWLAGELGNARDLDVLIERAGDGPLRERLQAARPGVYAAAVEALRSDRARMLMLDIVEWVSLGAWLSRADNGDVRTMPAREFAADALRRLRRTVKKGGRDLADLDDEDRHDVRKAAKRLRYATEFFASLYAGKRETRRHKRFVSALETLQDRLGELNDLAGTREVLERLGLPDESEADHLVDPARKSALLDAAAEDYDAFTDAKRFWR